MRLPFFTKKSKPCPLCGKDTERNRRRMKNFVKLAQGLVNKLEEINNSDDFQGIFSVALVHGHPYNGPTWEKELNALKEALDDISDQRYRCITGPGVHKILFFNDYSEDAAMPSSGRGDLVQQYKEIMDEQNKPIAIFDNRDELYDFVSEFGPQAKDGIRGFKEYSEAEMLELIDEAKNNT